MGFFVLKTDDLAKQIETGEAIIRVSNSVFQSTPASEWAKFDKDTKEWLFQNGYKYEGAGALPDGRIPASIDIIPVYDTPTKMHVRVPWAGDLNGAPAPADEPSYGNQFPVVLARYFMRRCR
jgi:hypothetical protein